MWQVDDPDRWARAISRPHKVTSRVEVWSAGVLQTERASFVEGSVKDEWVTGIRRSLSLTVPPSREWLAWFSLPQLELRPYVGIRFGAGYADEVPMGRFPVLPPELKMPAAAVSISANDYWERIGFYDFPGAAGSSDGPVLDALVRLIRDAGLPAPTINATSNPTVPGVIFTKSRQDAIEDLARSIAAECFIDRLGNPRITNARALGASQATLTEIGLSVRPDWSKVYNLVAAKSSAQDVDFPSQWISLDWSGHPAHPNQVGWTKTYPYASPLLRTPEQAQEAGRAILNKVASPARTTAYTVLPDPRLDAGDSVTGRTITGTEVCQIASITTPLQPGAQSIVTVSTQPGIE